MYKAFYKGPPWYVENKVFGYIIVYFTVPYLIVLYDTILCKLGYIGVYWISMGSLEIVSYNLLLSCLAFLLLQ